MQNSPELREWLKAQLHAKSWNQADLARESETSESTWTRIFQGKTSNLSPKVTGILCKEFHITHDQLSEIIVGNHVTPGTVLEASPLYETKWIRLGKWIETQPREIQNAFEAVATSHGWKS